MNILLLHGALGTRKQLSALGEIIPGASTRSFEFSGHGQRDMPHDGLTMELILQDIEDAMHQAGWNDAHLFGYSMGGYAALVFASRHPERVRSVTTLGTKLKWDREGLDRELRMLDPGKMQEKVPKFAAQLAAVHGPQKWEALVHATATLITSLHERPLLTPQILGSLGCPVMLCVGDRDGTAVAEHTLEVARSIPKGAALVLPATTHPIDQADHELLLAHMRKHMTAAEGIHIKGT